MEEGVAAVEKAGGAYHGQIKNVGKGPKFERKYRDPNGVVIDVAVVDHARNSWALDI